MKIDTRSAVDYFLLALLLLGTAASIAFGCAVFKIIRISHFITFELLQ